MDIARPRLALAALAFLLLLVAAIAGLRPPASASAAGSSARCGVAQKGTGAGETLKGTAGSDLINGLGGNDRIKGQGGGDCLRGGRGRDTVKGGGGHDHLKGGKGRDRFVARDRQRDVIRCGRGYDLARVDAKDKVRSCERVRRHASGGGHGGGAGYPSLRVGWDGDFDSGCRLVGAAPGSWDNNETNADHTGGSTRIERRIVGEGKCGAKFTNAPSGDMTRSELGRSATGAHPKFTYEMLVRVPSGQTFPKGSSLTQTKQEKSGGRGCYNGGLGISDGAGTTGGRLDLKTVFACRSRQIDGQRSFDLGVLPRGKWFALKVHEKFSNNPRVGFVQAWKDADGPGPGGYVEVVPRTHLDNETGRRVRLRIGSYRQATNHRTTVYIDGVHLDCASSC
jgi:polysaccharide lyase-like protein/hemolysin type calcium-binding protein